MSACPVEGQGPHQHLKGGDIHVPLLGKPAVEDALHFS